MVHRRDLVAELGCSCCCCVCVNCPQLAELFASVLWCELPLLASALSLLTEAKIKYMKRKTKRRQEGKVCKTNKCLQMTACDTTFCTGAVTPAEGHKDCVQLLLRRAAVVSTDFERTAAHRAAECGDKETLLAVLNAGCPVDAEDSEKMTPLLYAATRGHTDCMQLLLQRGADPNRRSKSGLDAANYAALRSAEALRVVLASLVQLPKLDDLFADCYLTMRPISDPVSLALACGCRMESTICWLEESRDEEDTVHAFVDCCWLCVL